MGKQQKKYEPKTAEEARALESAKNSAIDMLSRDRKIREAKSEAEKARANYDSTSKKRDYQVRDSSMPLAPTQFNDI